MPSPSLKGTRDDKLRKEGWIPVKESLYSGIFKSVQMISSVSRNIGSRSGVAGDGTGGHRSPWFQVGSEKKRKKRALEMAIF